MKTVIVPVDFSTPSLNAASYAVKMLSDSTDAKLILYNMYDKKDDEGLANEQLTNFQTSLKKNTSLNIETMAVHGSDLISEIERVVNHTRATLVVMGMNEKTSIEQIFVGSNALRLVDENVVPVLIVPHMASFAGVKNVALASDFKDVRQATPSVPIKAIMEFFSPALHVVNVDSEHYVSITAEYQKEKSILQEMFEDYNPEFYFIGMNDFFEAIERFIEDKNIDMLITIPRQHSRMRGVLRERHTKKLAYHTHVPILAVHE